MDDNIIQFPGKPRDFVEVGGLVDASSVTLGIHGDDVDPEAISGFLGCRPTAAHQRGDPRKSGALELPPWPSGAWLLQVQGHFPEGPEELTRKLAMKLPADPRVWDRLARQYRIRLDYGIHMDAWNRGFDLSPETINQIRVFCSTIGFDIYANGAGSSGDGP